MVIVVFGKEKRTATSVIMSELVFIVVSATVLRSGGREKRLLVGVPVVVTLACGSCTDLEYIRGVRGVGGSNGS